MTSLKGLKFVIAVLLMVTLAETSKDVECGRQYDGAENMIVNVVATLELVKYCGPY